MPTFITLANFTDQGARNIKGSPDRFQAYKQMAEAAGVNVKSVHWTEGIYDLVLIVDGPEDAVLLNAMKMAALGNVRTQTLRAHTEKEIRDLTSKL